MKPIRWLPLFLAACATQAPSDVREAGMARNTMEMFVMSQCPYGVEVENAIAPAADKLEGSLDVKIHFIGQGEKGSLSSMHGANEVAGDLFQVCAEEQDHARLLDFVVCQNENPRQVHENWKSCGERVGYDVAALETCATGDHGQELLAASFALADERGAHGSPTMFLDGKPYEGGRKTNDFLRAVCNTYDGERPAACADIPVPPKVDAIFLSDSRCAECDLHRLEPKLKGIFGGLQARYVDYSTEEGKTLYLELQSADPEFQLLPTVLLSPDADKDTEGYPAVARYTHPLGEYVELRVGGRFDPTAEICGNGGDDDADGAIDCDDSQCSSTLACRDRIAGKLDLYVMSHCPYGAKALIATETFLGTVGRDVDLDVHFIGDEQGGKLTSMHGQAEVDDDIREICAQKHYPRDNQYLKYMACFSQNYKGEWEPCAKEAGMDPSVIESCFASEGPDLLRKSFAQSAAMGISSSPTFLASNTRTFNAVDPVKLQREFCADNPGHQGCDTPIAAEAAATATANDASCN